METKNRQDERTPEWEPEEDFDEAVQQEQEELRRLREYQELEELRKQPRQAAPEPAHGMGYDPARVRAARERRRRAQRRRRILLGLTVVVLIAAATALIVSAISLIRDLDGPKSDLDWDRAFPLKGAEKGPNAVEPPDDPDDPNNPSGGPDTPPVKPEPITEAPDWVTKDFLAENEFSRPGTELPEVRGVVVHYVGNPGTTAKQNRSYFNRLPEINADKEEDKRTYASSHFIIDTDGTILQIIPLNEKAYATGKDYRDENIHYNDFTLSIECCHKDETGKFTDEELASLRKLLLWIIDTYDLSEDQVYRHYDCTRKVCPKYFVDNPEEWFDFRHSLFDDEEE